MAIAPLLNPRPLPFWGVNDHKSFRFMAGTTGLEPATSAVTVSQIPVTYRNYGQWVAPIDRKRHTEEQLLCPYCAQISGCWNFAFSRQRFCRFSANVQISGGFLLPQDGRGSAELTTRQPFPVLPLGSQRSSNGVAWFSWDGVHAVAHP